MLGMMKFYIDRKGGYVWYLKEEDASSFLEDINDVVDSGVDFMKMLYPNIKIDKNFYITIDNRDHQISSPYSTGYYSSFYSLYSGKWRVG